MSDRYIITGGDVELMLREIVEEVDYDIFKEIYVYPEQDGEDDTEYGSQKALREIVKKYLQPERI